jgi:hypothetical protein
MGSISMRGLLAHVLRNKPSPPNIRLCVKSLDVVRDERLENLLQICRRLEAIFD